MAKAPGFAAGSLLGLFGLAAGYLSQYAFNVSTARVASSPNLAGKIFQTIALVQFLAVLGRAGLDRVSLRTFGAAHGKHDGANLSGIWKRINLRILVLSTLVCTTAFIFHRPIFNAVSLPADNPYLPYLFFAGPFLALSFTASQALRGVGLIGRATMAQLTLVFAPPALIFAGLKLTGGIELSTLIWIFVSFTAVAAGFGYIWTSRGIERTVPNANGADGLPSLGSTRIPSGAASFFLLGILGYAQAGLEIVLLGAWSSPVEVTRYIATARTAMFVSLGFVGIASVLGRLYAAAHARQDHDEMRDTLDKAGRWALSFAVLAGGCLLQGHQLVLDLFDLKFDNALPCFGAILVGHTVNAGAGGLFLLLQMTGRERASTICLVAATGIALIAYWLLIPTLGAVGAASGLSVLMVSCNLFMAYVAKREFNLQPFSAKLIPSAALLFASYAAAYWFVPTGLNAILAIAIYFLIALAVIWKTFLVEQERNAIVRLLQRLKK